MPHNAGPDRSGNQRVARTRREQDRTPEELLGHSSFVWLTSRHADISTVSTITINPAAVYTHKDELVDIGGVLAIPMSKLGSCGCWKVNEWQR